MSIFSELLPNAGNLGIIYKQMVLWNYFLTAWMAIVVWTNPGSDSYSDAH